MSNNPRTWALIGFIGLIVTGLALIAVPLLAPTQAPGRPSSAPLAATSTVPSDVPYPDVIRVTVGNARAAQELKQAVFVDVRAKEQYDQSHIPGALSMPLSVFEEQMNKLSPDQWIITYCT
jgi:3-mercaptopyruvate sulfurtransferase SseA